MITRDELSEMLKLIDTLDDLELSEITVTVNVLDVNGATIATVGNTSRGHEILDDSL